MTLSDAKNGTRLPTEETFVSGQPARIANDQESTAPNLSTSAFGCFGDNASSIERSDISRLHGELSGASGTTVGDYALGDTLGKGTFGKVKMGLHLPTGERVAVKILEKSRIVQAADVARVAREIKILKRNRHPNVIQLYEVLDAPERIFLITEYVDAGEMFEYIVSHHRLREVEACGLFRQILDGLGYLHANGVTHRDLKPENVLLQTIEGSNEKMVKIADFGLSNIHDGGRLLKTACGSPCYAAPEMIQGKKYIGPVADMWSLGVVLFAMVCGYLPFEDGNTSTLYKKILNAEYKMPSFLSTPLQDLIKRILETDPTKRYSVEDIQSHFWLQSMRPTQSYAYETMLQTANATVLHEMVLEHLSSLNVDLSGIQDQLQANAHNRLTSAYYLIYNKLQRILRHQDQKTTKARGSTPRVPFASKEVESRTATRPVTRAVRSADYSKSQNSSRRATERIVPRYSYLSKNGSSHRPVSVRGGRTLTSAVPNAAEYATKTPRSQAPRPPSSSGSSRPTSVLQTRRANGVSLAPLSKPVETESKPLDASKVRRHTYGLSPFTTSRGLVISRNTNHSSRPPSSQRPTHAVPTRPSAPKSEEVGQTSGIYRQIHKLSIGKSNEKEDGMRHVEACSVKLKE